jgi:hypothetical protein
LYRYDEGRAGGGGGGGGWAVRLETDSLSGSAAERAAARSLRGLADTFAAQLAAVSPTVAIGGGGTSGGIRGGGGGGALDAATASVRLTFPTNRRWAVDRARRAGGGGGGGFFGGGSDDDDDGGGGSGNASFSTGSAFMALAGGHRMAKEKNKSAAAAAKVTNADGSGDFGLWLDEWDDAAPWAPWASLDDPWEAVELDASWTATPLGQLLGGRGLQSSTL